MEEGRQTEWEEGERERHVGGREREIQRDGGGETDGEKDDKDGGGEEKREMEGETNREIHTHTQKLDERENSSLIPRRNIQE